MTLRRTGILLVLLAGLTSVLLAQGTDSASAQSDKQFQAALQKEMFAGDLKAAIEEYRKIAERPRVDPALAAQALLRMAECYRKLGDSEAQKIYQRIISQFAAQKEVVSQARAGLAALKPATTPGLTAAPIDPRLGLGWESSPDGRLAVDNFQSDLVLHDIATGKARTLVKGTDDAGRVTGYPIWSPDSRRVAFNWRIEATKTVEVRIVEVQTGGVQTLAVRPGGLGGVTIHAWTTKGEVAWMAGQRDLFFSAISSVGEPQRIPLADGVQFGDVSPDGSQVYLLGHERLFRLNRATGEEMVLVQGFEVNFPRVSIDGRLIAYVSRQTGSWTLRVAPLTGTPISSSAELTALPPGANWSRFMHWTSSGRLSFDTELNTDNIYRLQLSGGAPVPGAKLQRLVHDSDFASNPIVSPDSRLIAYVGKGGINLMNADGSNEHPLGVEGLPLGWLSAEELIFSQTVEGGPLAVSTRTGTVRSISQTPLNAVGYSGALNQDTFQYLPAQNEFIIRRFVEGAAKFFVRRPGGEERALLEIPLGSNEPTARSRFSSWAMSPLADRLAYVSPNRPASDDYSLHMVTVGRGDDRIIAKAARPSMAWTSDGHRLVYQALNPAGLEFRSVDVDTGESKAVLEPRHAQQVFAQDSRWNMFGCSVSSDQTSLVCSAGVTTAYRYAWEGVTLDAVTKSLGAAGGAAVGTSLALSVRDERVFGPISRDGRYVAATMYGARVIVRDLSTGEDRVVAKASGPAETLSNAIVSPDGRRVLYQVNGERTARLMVVDVNGTNSREVATNQGRLVLRACDWTSDATTILALRGGVGPTGWSFQLIPLATGASKTIDASLNCGRISPDGRSIAYVNLERAVTVVPVDGGPSELLDQIGNAVDPVWSSDGSRVLFSRTRSEAPVYRSGNDLWAVRVVNGRKAGESELVKKNVGHVLGVTKNDEYYYTTHTMTADLYSVDLDPATSLPASRPKQLTTQYSNWGAAWSPDGQWLAYFSDRGTDRALVLRPAAGGPDRVITPTGFPPAGVPHDRPIWLPDGRSLIVRVEDRAQLDQVDVQTGAAKILIELQQPRLNISSYHGRVRLSADGKSVYYVSGAGNQSTKSIVRQNLDGGASEIVFRSPGTFVSGPSLSPDGTMLAFAASAGAFPDDDVSIVMVMPVTGGPPREICRVNDHVQDPIWTKDGQRLIFTTYNNPPHKDGKAEVWTVPLAGGQPKSLNLGLHWVFFADLSPDGKRMVVRDENFNNELWVIKGLFAK